MDYNNFNDFESEEEKKDKMRKKILDELNNNSMKKEGVNSNIQSFGQTKKKSAVSFSKDNSNVDGNGYSNNQSNNNENQNISTGKMATIFIIGIVAMLVIYFLPVISDKVDDFVLNHKKNKESSNAVQEEVEKVAPYKISDEVIKGLNYPIFHVDKSSKTTYLSQDKISVKDISNDDLLYNSFIRNSNLTTNYAGGYSTTYCGANNQKKSIKAYYLTEGVKEIFGKKTSVSVQSFSIPLNNGKTNYYGSWVYVKNKDYFVYMGDCKAKQANTLYYDISVPYDVESADENKNISVYSKIAFAMVDKSNKTYTLYSDANYTNEISSGTLKTTNYENELTSVAEQIKDKFNNYKFGFTQVNCPFKEYCFSTGEWVK